MKHPMRILSLAVILAMGTSAAHAINLSHVPDANPKVRGLAQPNALSPELTQHVVASGSMALEPNTSTLTRLFGYNYDAANDVQPSLIPLPGSTAEASKTEPDKNTYLVLSGQHGADPSYNYGTHFVFQGHEMGAAGYITRVNLDADLAHRVTLLADKDKDGNALPTFDGSTWYPFSNKLLFTAESASSGGVWQADADYTGASTVEGLTGILGQGGYEGIQADPDGNLWIVEDTGGVAGSKTADHDYSHAKQPNSFVFRFIPKDKTDLKQGGVLQALQVIVAGHPVEFHAGQPDQDIFSQDMLALHTYGRRFDTQWVTIHNTDTDGTAPFSANLAAKANHATPFKRPENGVFQPGSGFKRFVFTETGDTNALTEATETYGGFGGLFAIYQDGGPSASTGWIKMIYRGDVNHTGLDNIAFISPTQIIAGEDAGDTLHKQRNALDSAFLFDAKAGYGDLNNVPVRIIAEGRDISATLDSAMFEDKVAGFQNDGDNEITGILISDGDATANGLLGAKIPRPFQFGWRFFWTQQHGDNTLWEVDPARKVGNPVLIP